MVWQKCSGIRRSYLEEEERRYPDSPDGIVVAAVNNKSFAERFIDAFRLAKEGVKNNGRR